MNKGLTFKMGQTHVQKYMPMLFDKIEKGEIDPSFIITHEMPLEAAPDGYKMFKNKEDNCIKIVLRQQAKTFFNFQYENSSKISFALMRCRKYE